MFINDYILAIKAGRAILSKNYSKTIQLYKEFLKKHPNDSRILYNLFVLSLKACDWMTFLDTLNIYVKIWADDLAAQIWIGGQYLSVNQNQLADELFTSLLSNYAKFEDQDNLKPKLFAKKVISCFRLESYAEMEHYIQKTLEGDPLNLDAHYITINYLYLTARGGEVPAYLEKINFRTEDRFIKNFWLADHLIYYDLDYSSGLTLYREIFANEENHLQENETLTQSYYNSVWGTDALLGEYIDRLGMGEQIVYLSSKELINLVMKIVQSNTTKNIYFALIDQKIGKPSDSERILRSELTKKNPPIDQSYLYRTLAEIYLENNQYFEAKETIEKSLALNPYDTHAKTIYGKCLIATDCQVEAKALFEKLLIEDRDNFPEYIDHLSDLGMVYVALNEVEKAKQNFERLISVHPKNARAQGMLEKLS